MLNLSLGLSLSYVNSAQAVSISNADGTPTITVDGGIVTITFDPPSRFAGTYSVDTADFDSVDTINLVPPSFTGTALVGEDLTYDVGLWVTTLTSPPQSTFEVTRDGTVTGSLARPSPPTPATYTSVSADAGLPVTVIETFNGVAASSAAITPLDVVDDFEVANRDLAGYTGASGGLWSEDGVSGATVISNGRVRGGVRYERGYGTRAGTSSTDARIISEFRETNDGGDLVAGVMLSYADSNNFYLARHNRNNAEWRIMKQVAGVFSTLGTYSDSFATGQTRLITFEKIGSNLRCVIDGVERIAVTDTSFTSGLAGIFVRGGDTEPTPTDTQGVVIENFLWESLD